MTNWKTGYICLLWFSLLYAVKSEDERQKRHDDDDGFWMDWTAWSKCSTSCGPGTYIRMRMCMGDCVGRTVEMRGCNDDVSCPRGVWAQWADWGPCEASNQCVQERRRLCVTEESTDAQCDGIRTQKRRCWEGECNKSSGSSSDEEERIVTKNLSIQDSQSAEDSESKEDSRSKEGSEKDSKADSKEGSKKDSKDSSGKHSKEGSGSKEDKDSKEVSSSKKNSKEGQSSKEGKTSKEGDGSKAKSKEEKDSKEKSGAKQPDSSDTKKRRVGPWGDWSVCQVNCRQIRLRQCENCAAAERVESRKCLSGDCPHDTWNQWISWSDCQCPVGQRVRTRTCPLGKTCGGSGVERATCPCSGALTSGGGGQNAGGSGRKWGTWGSWSRCDCKSNKRTRTRKCQDLRGCDGLTEDTSECLDKSECQPNNPENGWGPWDNWGPCAQTCGGGTRSRKRMCTLNRGTCTGDDVSQEVCSTARCPGSSGDTPAPGTGGSNENGSGSGSGTGGGPGTGTGGTNTGAKVKDTGLSSEWSLWSSWGGCDCYDGFRRRTRLCSFPKPPTPRVQAPCLGNDQDYEACEPNGCNNVNGGWGSWSEWSGCPDRCGCQVDEFRVRSCSEPHPLNDGADCFGKATEFRDCPRQPCDSALVKTNGAWVAWSEWSTCVTPCGRGHRWRGRDCADPPPNNGGNYCPGPLRESQPCTAPTPCPYRISFGDWTEWSAWSECSATCGKADRSSWRGCTEPRPTRGRKCYGRVQWLKPCPDLPPCKPISFH